MAKKKKRNTRFRKKPLTADFQNWNEVDWRIRVQTAPDITGVATRVEGIRSRLQTTALC